MDRLVELLRAFGCSRVWAVALVAALAAGCSDGSRLDRQMEARRLSSELLVQFGRATDAANMAVMAGHDQTSAEFAREAEEASLEVYRDADLLRPLLTGLGYGDESRLLDEFTSRFAAYRELDGVVRGLAVENTNLKAQRLSFGPAQKEADTFRQALESIVRSSPPKEVWQVKALTATALSAVREIQVVEAPHIAEEDDAAMTRFEEQMASSAAAARGALESLAGVVTPASKPQLAAAAAALERFVDLNGQIIELSRRNTNVRSLALSMGEKRKLTARCEESLNALQDALRKRSFTGTR